MPLQPRRRLREIFRRLTNRPIALLTSAALLGALLDMQIDSRSYQQLHKPN